MDLFSDHVLVFLDEVQKVSDKAERTLIEHSPAGLKLKRTKQNSKPINIPVPSCLHCSSTVKWQHLRVGLTGKEKRCAISVHSQCNLLYLHVYRRQCPIASVQSFLLESSVQAPRPTFQEDFPEHCFQTS